MKILGLCTYPLEAAATRYRLLQYVEPLAEKGIELEVSPFLSKEQFATLYKSGSTAQKVASLLKSGGKRFFDSFGTKKYNAVIIQRESMLYGPPVSEWLIKNLGKCPLILDLDDATYLKYISPTYGRLGSALKFFGKTDKLISWSETVLCGNRHIAEYVRKKGTEAVIVPTIVDTKKFCPIEKKKDSIPVLGWIGTHSTFPFLESLFPVFEKLAENYNFILRIVGAGINHIDIKGVKIENLEWSLETEIRDFQTCDIGLYPMRATETFGNEWLMGKSGFKAIQYMAVGIPYIVTPVGITAEIGIENETHFTAENNDQWQTNLSKLLGSYNLRKTMGRNGRKYSLKHFTVGKQTDIITEVLTKAV